MLKGNAFFYQADTRQTASGELESFWVTWVRRGKLKIATPSMPVAYHQLYSMSGAGKEALVSVLGGGGYHARSWLVVEASGLRWALIVTLT